MSSKAWRQLGSEPCPQCGGVVEQRGGRGRPRKYCSAACRFRHRILRDAIRNVRAVVDLDSEAISDSAWRLSPRYAMTVGEEFALLRKQRRARMEEQNGRQ